MTTRHALLPTSIGELTAVLDGAPGAPVLVGLYFPGHWTLPDPDTFGRRTGTDEPVLTALATQLGEYLDGERRDFDLPLDLRGGEHHRRVWQRLTRIPYGETLTYGELAHELGGAAQSVGRAVGANPISIVVPCHRVVGADGSLTGYAGGIERKRALLALEEPAAQERDALF
ncbi:methylated-DNA--[protein]-cysteine S-methyltransferase [Janibacter cremeus]|uniref:Methylated-DNA--protein-cysteine methyltransferase n=1 Tax=Janibacter cremeus TaxID=1285192 RepID=A0A852VQJ2_9MICO|nr:methylated-DNA--[protein]-cysteine S-methyltransferase [Janibacter cremeus]NYF97720.1 methylated-DNA-[protein]-cysteine S-methyltransferase [Janibacter cremeus]